MILGSDDRLAIHELLSLHGHLMDDRELSRLHELFTEDAVYDVQDFGLGTHQGFDRLRALVLAAGDANPLAHHVTNVVVTQDADGRVHARSKGLGVLSDGRAGSVVYTDLLVKTRDGWRIAHRVVAARRPSLPPPTTA